MSDTFHILLDLGLYVCMGYLIFSKEYLKKKGANLADKQDIEDITSKIEQVKSQFVQENEILKSNLQLITKNQLQYTNEERNALVNFFDYYGKWLTVGLQGLNFYYYTRNNIQDLIQKDRQLEDFYTQTSIAHHRISLLVDDKELVAQSHKLIMKTLEYNHWTQNLLLKLRLNLEDGKMQYDQFLKLNDLNPLSKEAQQIIEREKELKKERGVLDDTYYAEKVNKFKEVLLISVPFTESVKRYLKKTV
jgi:hypothetical protein